MFRKFLSLIWGLRFNPPNYESKIFFGKTEKLTPNIEKFSPETKNTERSNE
jgi:hypothetical protein